MELFQCSKCGNHLPRTTDFFYRFKFNKDGLRTHCKDCHNKATAENQKTEEAKKRQKDYYQKNKKELLEKNKIYCKSNKKLVSSTRNNYFKLRRQRDAGFKSLSQLRSLLRGAIVSGYTPRAKKTTEIFGCDYKTFKQHIESLFKPGMTWEKFRSGLVHLDHIKPCCLFNLENTDEQKACFHYTNIQPLWAIENIEKRLKDIALLKAA